MHSTAARIVAPFLAALAAVAALSVAYGQQPPPPAGVSQSSVAKQHPTRDPSGPTLSRFAAAESSSDAPIESDLVQQKTSTIEALPTPPPAAWPETGDPATAKPVEASSSTLELKGRADREPTAPAAAPGVAVKRQAEILLHAAPIPWRWAT